MVPFKYTGKNKWDNYCHLIFSVSLAPSFYICSLTSLMRYNCHNLGFKWALDEHSLCTMRDSYLNSCSFNISHRCQNFICIKMLRPNKSESLLVNSLRPKTNKRQKYKKTKLIPWKCSVMQKKNVSIFWISLRPNCSTLFSYYFLMLKKSAFKKPHWKPVSISGSLY